MQENLNGRRDGLPMGTMLHGHEVVGVLGSGGFSIVYFAINLETGAEVVIKEYMPDNALRDTDGISLIPKSNSDRENFSIGLEAFVDEAFLLMELSHPNIVRVLEVFKKFSTAYFVMPYVKGMEFSSWVEKNPKPSQNQLADIFVPILEALNYLHGIDYLHRDIKPDNIIICENGNPVLIDFGAARQTTARKSQVLTRVVTAHYAAIEQYSSSGPFTPALDFYGLAASMYFAITQESPVESTNRVTNDLYKPLFSRKNLTKKFSEGFLKTIDKNLSLFAKNRHQTAFDFQLCLIGEKPVEAKEANGNVRVDNLEQLQAMIAFTGNDGVISLVEQAGLLQEAKKLNISEVQLWDEIANQANNNNWDVEINDELPDKLEDKLEDKAEDELEKLDPEQDLDEIKELVRIKGFQRFMLHFSGVIMVAFAFIVLLFFALGIFGMEDGRFRTLSEELFAPNELSIAYQLVNMGITHQFMQAIIGTGFFIIHIGWAIIYLRIVSLDVVKQNVGLSLYYLNGSVIIFLQALIGYNLLVINWSLEGIITFIFLLLFISHLFVYFNLDDKVDFSKYKSKEKR